MPNLEDDLYNYVDTVQEGNDLEVKALWYAIEKLTGIIQEEIDPDFNIITPSWEGKYQDKMYRPQTKE